MIIARSPLRITLGGVSTDIPAYYRHYGGFLVAAAIDKYVHVAVSRSLEPGIIVRSERVEQFATADDVSQPIIREALRLVGYQKAPIEMTIFSDVPAGTGLGSSGSLTTALLLALHAYGGTPIDAHVLAEQACHIEMDRLGEPIGKQDQYVAALGGLVCLTFTRDGTVSDERLVIGNDARAALEGSILLFFTGGRRSASDILRGQVARLESREPAIIDALHFEMENAAQSRSALEAGDLHRYAHLLGAHWDRKRQRNSLISTPEIDRLYELGLANGALGGKLVGAGGGGFLMFCTEDGERLRNAMRRAGLAELPFRFEPRGTCILTAPTASGERG